jgi:hypothetical protein
VGLSLLAVGWLLASGLTACELQCSGTYYDFAGDARGEATPAAAIERWKSESPHPWHGGWSPGPDDGTGAKTFINGDWSVTVAPVPAGGWLVNYSTNCRS